MLSWSTLQITKKEHSEIKHFYQRRTKQSSGRTISSLPFLNSNLLFHPSHQTSNFTLDFSHILVVKHVKQSLKLTPTPHFTYCVSFLSLK